MRTKLMALTTTLLLAAACGGKAPAPAGRQPSAGVPSAPPGAVNPTPVPTTALPEDATQYATGTAEVKVSGGVDADLSLTLAPGSLLTAGGMALSYSDEAGNFFGFGGTTFSGKTKTSSTLSLSITTVKPATSLFVSINGECTLQLEKADAKGASGSFTCSKLRSSGETVDASGTFTAAV